jgi:hypothetical protein
MDLPGRIAVLRIIAIAWCVVVVGYIAWGWYDYAGLYRVFAEWQIGVFGGYRVFLTALLPAIVLALPGLWIAGMLQRASGTLQTVPADPRRGLWAITVMGLMGLGIAAVAGTLGWQRAMQVPEVAALDLRQTTALPEADRFVVTGVARTDLMMSVETETGGAKRNYTYVPLTPPDWQRGQPLAYFLKTNQNAYLPPGGGRMFRLSPGEAPFPMTTQPAAIEANKLPGRVRDAYRSHNVALAPRIVVFTQGASATLEHYWIATAIGAMIAVACLLAAAITALRLRRRAS